MLTGGEFVTVREHSEEIERKILSSHATFAASSRGRDRPEEQCPLRTVFQRDRDRIIHCKAFRRLKYKTQVFLSPEGDHYSTRLTHTLEVAQIARTCARALRLNEDLTEAIALGHDLGHTPFGHAGERALNSVCPGGFQHNVQSVRVVQRLEEDGQGLNLTWETRDGIENHTEKGHPATLEGKIVQISDRIAYINHDIEDAIRGGLLAVGDLPWEAQYVLGREHSQRINTLITDLVSQSEGTDDILMSQPVTDAFGILRKFMFDSVYLNPVAKSEEGKAEHLVVSLYHFFCENSGLMHQEYRRLVGTDGLETSVCDYIAGMTDRYAVQQYSNLFIPKTWKK